MRIQNNLKPNVDTLKKEKQDVTQKSSFSSVIVHSKQKLHQQELTALLLKIEEKGALLAQKMTVENVRDYKKLVTQFVEEVVQYGLDMSEKHGFQPNGRPKQYKIVEEIDQKLVELTNKVLQEEKSGIEILDMVGEIKGLLINLYM